jgi:hypothetical protein
MTETRHKRLAGHCPAKARSCSDCKGKLPARSEQQFTLTQRASKVGIWPVEFSLDADEFEADNQRFTAVRIVDPLRCLLVYGGADPREVDPLRFALDPQHGRLGRERLDLQLKIVPRHGMAAGSIIRI